ncbi:magnesium/cobalt transporter CorA [Clostridium sp. CX1]|uniref:Magnesium transport protein CorA n=1 Tax=Clostridium tanneri TaxID=3037988 RepID=A0ABU4JTP4_9CLOT|nr:MULTISPECIES: magnesium/cobalt transporter CorA [unclassified Clostridium]MCT8975674.1 magnesium/cobalt transporter CorA [Clostridium sp. CX1]MDW8801521.1 magnesium/cobalt transporter CorA [Clostridium sp. A1-XYC3]
MIRIITVSKNLELKNYTSIDSLSDPDISWYWVDMEEPNEGEQKLLRYHFGFHPLAIEDCLQISNRPKLDYYGDYDFFVINALNKETLCPEDIGLFVGANYIVSVHRTHQDELDHAWERISVNKRAWEEGPTYVAYSILDKVVDQFFPAIYKIEDSLEKIDNNVDHLSVYKLVDQVFDIRGDLLQLRRIVNSMRDLLYRIVNSERLNWFKENKFYFADVHDHLLKLSEMIEANRDITADMRDSYMSINSNRMNTNMMVLTVISTIFIPLTFIAGVYGMNFDYMPELRWRYGYFAALFFMFGIAVLMFLWFKRKGWFDIYK